MRVGARSARLRLRPPVDRAARGLLRLPCSGAAELGAEARGARAARSPKAPAPSPPNPLPPQCQALGPGNPRRAVGAGEGGGGGGPGVEGREKRKLAKS